MKINVVPIIDIPKVYLERLQKLGDVEVFSTFFGDPDMEKKVKGAEILVLQPRLSLDIVPFLDKCKFIAIMATGYDALNVAAAKERGIKIANVRDWCGDAVAEFIIGLCFALSKELLNGITVLREEKWFKPVEFGVGGISSKTIGIFGFGNIGQKVTKLAKLLGMQVISCTRSLEKHVKDNPDVEFVSFDELLTRSDFLSLCAPVTPETKEIFNMEAFKKMKKSGFFINTARGALVKESDLAEALNQGIIAGAGIDVFQKEPPSADHVLLNAKNCICSPHVSWATEQSFNNLWEEVVSNVEAFSRGEERNII